MSKFRTVRFGELEYDAKDEIFLPDGLVGMVDLKRWLILDMGEDLPMKFFQSLDRGDFGFPVTQPYLFHDEYEFQVPAGARKTIENKSDENLTPLIITTVHPGGTMVTGNLLAPLVLDAESRRGIQLTLDDDKFSIRQEINYFKFGLAVQGEASDNVSPDDQEQGSSASVAEETEDKAQAQAGAENSETVGV
jgi:flagellar assembly factor FliW